MLSVHTDTNQEAVKHVHTKNIVFDIELVAESTSEKTSPSSISIDEEI
jgi:hypothetical protein